MDLWLTVETARVGAIGKALAAPAGAGAARWQVEVGQLNRVVTLAPAAPATPPYLDVLLRRSVRPLRVAKPLGSAPADSPLFELREYRLVPGGAEKFVPLMLAVMPVRERYSPNLGVFTPATDDPDRIIHLWAYRDLAHRAAVRGGVAKEADWGAYIAGITPLLVEMESTLMTAA